MAKRVPTAILVDHPPSPRDPGPPTVIEAVAAGRVSVDEAVVHIIGNAFGDGCTPALSSRRGRSSKRAAASRRGL